LLHNDILKDYLDRNKLLLSELDFQYVTESQFNSVLGSYKDCWVKCISFKYTKFEF